MGIAKNRVFDSGEIKNLAAQTETLLKKADEVLSSLKGESERLYTTVNSISIDLRNTGLLSLASSLKGTFSGENYAVYRSSLAKELKKQYQEIPNQDSSIAKSTKTAISTTKKMTKRIQSLEGLIPKGAELQSRNQERILDTYRYSYDQTGRIVGMERQTSAHSEKNGAYTYAYDSLGRLTQVQKDGSPCRSYAYDQTGNRIWKEETGAKERVETNYAYSNTGQLLLERRNNQEITYRYDGRGNLTEILENGISKFSYRYGATNRMEKANRHQEAQALY